ncbi:MAG: hypothetical protein HPY90_12890 [Syntrophothermus sp.]|uniref:CobW family GTP-binding protein n=1 Tax=Syntrophothermus sp. TaxID=2736299 RepID=UPI00257C13CC|nr:GTP-binding protein [Syntrophothermus sp.]NSW84144.1 hypothetical protein [Syntrophothermus sp.]
MKIVVMAGFLGSGKTSTLKNLIPLLQETDFDRIAVIINDFGEIGIDTSVVRRTGIDTVELISGCVCCQLGVDLLKTIKDIHKQYQPSTVILEPSGVANPASIKDVIRKLKDVPVDKVINLVLVDPIRFDLIVEIPIIEIGISVADVLVITKIDLVDDSTIHMLKNELRRFNKTAKILEITNQEQSTLNSLIEVIKNECSQFTP